MSAKQRKDAETQRLKAEKNGLPAPLRPGAVAFSESEVEQADHGEVRVKNGIHRVVNRL
jgi:hypothetical protein